MTPQELQTLRNWGQLGEDAADTIDGLAERVRVLREALEKIERSCLNDPPHVAQLLHLAITAHSALAATK